MKVALFSHYNTTSNIPQYVIVYLKQLIENFDQVILISNFITLNNSDSHFLKSKHILHYQVYNEGFDFGMWQKTIKYLNIKDVSLLCLCNDSCVPVRSLKSVVVQHQNKKEEICGITDSFQIKYHLQSYFLTFKNRGIEFINSFLKTNKLDINKSEIINNFEIGLSQKAKENKLGLFTSFPVKDFGNSDFNPCYAFFIQNFKRGCPLIKKRIIFNQFNSQEKTQLSKIMNFSVDYKQYFIEHMEYNIFLKNNLNS